MAYATQDDLVPLRLTLRDLVELTDDTQSEDEPGHGEVNTDTVANVLKEASARVDSFCRQRYTVPLQPSETIKGLTLDIAVYFLFTRRRETTPTETVRQNYQDAMQFLKAISTGSASLDQPVDAQPQGSSGEAVVTRIPDIFSDQNLRGW